MFFSLIFWVNCDGSRPPKFLIDEGLPFVAFCSCHRNGLQGAVSPVDVAMDPIHHKAFWGFNPIFNHDIVVSRVAGRVYV